MFDDIFDQTPSEEENHLGESKQRTACNNKVNKECDSKINRNSLPKNRPPRPPTYTEKMDQLINLPIAHRQNPNQLTKHIRYSEQQITLQLNPGIIDDAPLKVSAQKPNSRSLFG